MTDLDRLLQQVTQLDPAPEDVATNIPPRPSLDEVLLGAGRGRPAIQRGPRRGALVGLAAAAVVVPVAKLVGGAYLVAARHPDRRVHAFLERVGRWAMVDVFVGLPGASPSEVENRITIPLERRMWELPGVEYVYSASMPGMAIVMVRFYVGLEIDYEFRIRMQRRDVPARTSLSRSEAPVLGWNVWLAGSSSASAGGPEEIIDLPLTASR